MTAFYEADGDRIVPSELTRGPWSPDAQHAGPPSALVGRAIERCEPREGWQVGRITCEILRPVPLTPLTTTARVVRPGRSVELLEATLSDERGEVMRATAWRLRTADIPIELPAGDPPPGPETGRTMPFPSDFEVGFHTGVDYRFIRGSFFEPGPALCWIRMRQPLVAGEEPTPLQRTLVAADSGNGVSAALDWSKFLFINCDLTVALHRPPEGEWVCLDAVTTNQPHGVGLADTTLLDARGPIGRGVQTLLVGHR